MIRVREMGQDESLLWDNFVDNSPQALVFQRWDWFQLLLGTYPSLKCIRLGCFDEKENLIAIQSNCSRVVMGVTMPAYSLFPLYNGPLLKFFSGEKRLDLIELEYEAMQGLASEIQRRLGNCEFITHPSIYDVHPYLLMRGWKVAPYYTYTWNTRHFDKIWERMVTGKRREIRRSLEKFSFGIESADKTIPDFIDYCNRHMPSHGWTPPPYWCQNFQKWVTWLEEKKMGVIYTARAEDGALAAAMVFLVDRFTRTAYVWRVIANPLYEQGRITAALYWKVAHEFEHEVDRIDLGHDGNIANLGKFKRSLGADLEVSFRIQYLEESYKINLINHLRQLKHKIFKFIK